MASLLVDCFKAVVMTAVLGATLTGAARDAAARPPCDGSGLCADGSRREARQQEIAALHARVLKERVGLTDARVAEVETVRASFKPQRQTLRQEMRAAREAIVALVKADGSDDVAYMRALATADRLREQGHALHKAQREAVGKLLSARERARLMVAMQEVRRHKRGHGPGPDADGPELDD